MLVEEGRTNYLIQSEFTDGLPASRGGLVTATTFDGLTAGTGLAIGWDGTTSTYFYVTNYAVPASTSRSISIFVRMDDGGAPAFGTTSLQHPANDFVFNLGGYVVSPTAANGGIVRDYGGGLYRVSVPITTSASPVSTCGVIKYGANSSRTFKCSGIMVESTDTITSYIPTGAAQSSRAQDTPLCSGVDFTWFNPIEGTLLVEFDRLPLLTVTTDRYIMDVGDGTTGSRILFYSAAVGKMLVVSGGANQFSFANMGSLTAGVRQKMGMAYAAVDFAGCLNGGMVYTNATGALPSPNPTQIMFGYGYGGGAFNGHIRSATYYNHRLPNADLQRLAA